jgi:hypothetical protein
MHSPWRVRIWVFTAFLCGLGCWITCVSQSKDGHETHVSRFDKATKLLQSGVETGGGDAAKYLLTPGEILPAFEDLVVDLEADEESETETGLERQEFHLVRADAVELATLLKGLYPSPRRLGYSVVPSVGSSFPESRRVIVQSNLQSHSIIVCASRKNLTNIAQLIGRLDSAQSRGPVVFSIQIPSHPQTVQEVLEDLFRTNVTRPRKFTAPR